MIRARIAVVVAAPITITAFLQHQLRALGERHYLTVVVNGAPPDLLDRLAIRGTLFPVAIERPIAPWRDLKALLRLYRLFRRERFDLVYSVTPKAGLLAQTAACLAWVPQRLHTFTGQVWATRRGPVRMLLKSMDRLLARCATRVLADSPSQRRFLIAEGVTRAERLEVLADGSISGVDVQRFHPDPDRRRAVREGLDIPETAVLGLFLGRLNADKGVAELAAAFAEAAGEVPALHLLVVGPDEAGMQAGMQAKAAGQAGRLHFVGYTDAPENYMQAADFFVLPSYREGFGSVIIEAAACGLPAIGSRIYGLTDAIEEGVTGLLVPAREVAALAEAMLRLATDSELRRGMGEAACARARRDFSQERLTQAVLDYFGQRIGLRGQS